MYTIDDIASAWRRCLHSFNSIQFPASQNAAAPPSSEHALSLAFEVERNRLMLWGVTAGLKDVSHTAQTAGRAIPPAGFLSHDPLREFVGEGLSMFASRCTPKSLRKNYGLVPLEPSGFTSKKEEKRKSSLRGLFKRLSQSRDDTAGESSTAQSESESPAPGGAATLVVRKEAKFRTFVAEVKQINDKLDEILEKTGEGDAAMNGVRANIAKTEDLAQLRELWNSSFKQLGLDGGNAVNTKTSPIATSSNIAPSTTATRTVTSGPSDTTAPTPQASTDVPPVSSPSTTSPDDAAGELAILTVIESQGPVSSVKQEQKDEQGQEDELKHLENSVSQQIYDEVKGVLNVSLIAPNEYETKAAAYVEIEGYREEDQDALQQKDSGMVKSTHPAFDLYRRKRYIKKKDKSEWTSAEDRVLLSPEADPRYEHVNPGTVTIKGFALEVWDYEEDYGRPRQTMSVSSRSSLPDVTSNKLLRRIDELQKGSIRFGSDPVLDEDNMEEFFGTMGIVYFTPKKPEDDISNIYMQLNRTDGIFASFNSSSSIGTQRSRDNGIGIGFWNFLWQIILAKELALRLEHYGAQASWSGFTERVLASLVVQDLWLQNVTLRLVDMPVTRAPLKRATPEEEARTAGLKREGDEAMGSGKYDKAFEAYNEMLEIVPNNAAYRAARSAASLGLGRVLDALEDAYVSTILQPDGPEGWMRMGAAEMKRGHGKKAREAYQKAIDVAGPGGVTEEMRQGLKDADARVGAETRAIDDTVDLVKNSGIPGMRYRPLKAHRDKDFDTALKTVDMRSNVHERQVDGLLLFARRMKWPYMDELRACAETAYERLLGGEAMTISIHDWLFGLTLPGHFMAYKIMATLIMLTPSVKHISPPPFYHSGLYLPGSSYWRLRTVLGSVLAALPGVVSLCGWVGRCPAPEFDPPLAEGAAGKPRHIRLQARRVPPSPSALANSSGARTVGHGSFWVRSDALYHGHDEDKSAWAAEFADANSWVELPPPQHDPTSVTLKTIVLKQLPLEETVADEKPNKTANEDEAIGKAEYQASLTFELDSKPGHTISFTMYTSPVFVTLPPCHPPGNSGAGSSTSRPHNVHTRELSLYASLKAPVSVAELQDSEIMKERIGSSIDDPRGIPMIINATGQGGELMARAWCAAVGKSASIRKPGGPCFVCAVDASARAGLGTEVLIWAS